MSVLKAKRTVSKAEFVNTANQIYVETLNFLTRMSARYARLLAEPVAKLAGEVVDHCEKANSIFAKGSYTDAQAQRNILSNPFKRFEDMQMLHHGIVVRGLEAFVPAGICRGKSISESAGCKAYPLLYRDDAKSRGVFYNKQW